MSVLPNFSGEEWVLRRIAGILEEQSAEGYRLRCTQLACVRDAFEISDSVSAGCTSKGLDYKAATLGKAEIGRQAGNGERRRRLRGRCGGEAGPAKNDGVGVGGGYCVHVCSDEGGDVNGNCLAEMNGAGVGSSLEVLQVA